MYNLEAAFKQIISRRRSAFDFDPTRTIEDSKLKTLQELCLRAPSAYNSQPFRCVLITDDQTKKDLAHVMMSIRNARRVTRASITAVFLADTECWKNFDELPERENATYEAIKRKENGIKFMGGYGGASMKNAAIATSKLAPTAIPNDPVVWALKSTMLFVDHYILTCAALGLSTSPMEGFDEHRARSVVNASGRYFCPLVVPTGYGIGIDENSKLSERKYPEQVFFRNKLPPEYSE